MTQELLGGGAGLERESKTCNSGGVLEGSPSFPSLSVSLTPTITATDAAAATSSDRQHLRCPRCDSSNTKFCYYNNYNLTQPRHFCKSCRRYWTQGGALRNIPIGGGCRKNKNSSASITAGKSSSGRIKTVPSNIGKSNLGSGFDLEVPSNNPIVWASPQYSQLLTFLRATQNPNPISGSVTVKDEGGIIGSHRTFESAMAKGVLDARTLSLDQLNQVPLGLCSSFWRNSQHQPQHQLQNNLLKQHQHSSLLGGMPNSGIQELYQRLRSQENCYSDHSSPSLKNVASSSPSASSILDPSATAAGEMGIWNPLFSWSNLPPTNGAYP